MSDQPARPLASRRPLPGSEAALTALREDIAVLEAELYELERRTAELELDDTAPAVEASGPPSTRMADDLGTASVEQERADMTRFLDGTLAVCEALVAEARSEARATLEAARADLARAVQDRAARVEELIASPPTPPDPEVSNRSAGGEVEATAGAGAAVETAPLAEGVEPVKGIDPGRAAAPVEGIDPSRTAAPVVTVSPTASGRRRASVISVLMWIVGGALVVVGVAFAIVVVLMLLD